MEPKDHKTGLTSRREKGAQEGGAPCVGRNVQRREAATVGAFNQGAGGDERINNGEVALFYT